MATNFKLKRSSVASKRPGLSNLELGELALNTFDGFLFTERNGLGITTVTNLTPWYENYGAGSIFYINKVGIGTTAVPDTNQLLIKGGTETDNINVTGIATVGSLTSGRVVTVGTGGKLQDSSNLTFDGTTLKIPDGGGNSNRIAFGNSEDLKIYHDASDSYIANTTGVFYVQNTGDLRIRVDNTDAAVHCVRNGAVELYHAGTKKLETSSSGATVTGTLNVTSGITVADTIDANGDLDVDGHTNLDNVNIAGVTTTAGLLDIDAGGQANTFKVEDLTSGRIVLAGTGGELEDTNNLRYDGSNLIVNGITITGGSTIGPDVVTRNLKVTGISTFVGIITASVTQNVIPFYYNNVSDFPSASAYHGAFAHAHNTGKAYFAHAGWKEIVSKEADGTIGVGTEQVRVGITTVTTFNATGNVTLGDADTDNVVFNAEINSNIIPNTNIAYDLGSSTKRWGNLHVNKITNSGGGTVIDDDITTRNLSVTGLSTFTGNIDANGNLDVDGTTELDDVNVAGVIDAPAAQHKIAALYNNFSDLPSAGTYHGMFAHVHARGKGYFAHGGAWYELVNKELDGTIGVGTEQYNIGIITATNATFSGNVSIGGTLTYEDVTNIDSLGIVTARTGIKVLAGGINAVGIVTADGLDAIEIKDDGSSITTGAVSVIDFTGGNTITYNAGTRTVTVPVGSGSGGGTGGKFVENNTGIHTLSNVGIGTTNASDKLKVLGDVAFTGALKVSPLGLAGSNGQFLKSVGTGVTWSSFPTARTVGLQTATANQTSFPFTYNVGFLDVYINGVKLTTNEFTATNGTSVVLSEGAFLGDQVQLISFNTTATGGGGGGSGITDVVQDASPQLGGNLDLNSKVINGSGNIDYTGNFKASGIATVTDFNATGNVTLGDSATDTISMSGDVNTNILPSTDGTKNLGNSSNRWGEVHAVTFQGSGAHLSGVVTSIVAGSNITLTGGPTGIVTIASSGGGGATDSISEGNTKAEVSDTGSNGRFFVETEGTEKFSIDSTGDFKFNQCNDSEFNANGNLTLDYKSSNSLRLRQQYTSAAVNLILFNVPLTIWNNSDAATTIEFHRGDRIQVGTGASISVNGNIFSAGIVTATTFSGSGASLTSLPAANLTGTLPALNGSALTGIAVTEAPVTDYTITASGSSAYRIAGGGVNSSSNNPDLYLERGKKYRFNNTTGSSHPFRFRISSGGSTYSTGVSGVENGVQFFTVPYDAPPSIVYQCTIHSGMVGTIYIGGGQYQTRSNNLCLQYTKSSSNVTSGTVIYDTEVFDVGDSNAYNTSNGEFTAPITGVYRIQYEHFAASGRATANIEKSTNGGSSWSVIKAGMRVYSSSSNASNWADYPTIYYAQLNANDKFRIVHREGTIHLNTPWNHLTVQLVQ